MTNEKNINILVYLIIILTFVVSIVGVLTSSGANEYIFTSIFNNKVEVYGTGIYQYDSVSVVAQGFAQDIVSLLFGIPLLLYALYLYNKKSVKGQLLLSGVLGYFLYTYMSYTFLWHFNSLFLLYVALMSMSTFALIIVISNMDIKNLKSKFNDKLPTKLIGGIQIFIGVMIGLMWLKMLLPAIIEGSAPTLIEHYNTMVIQAMDLGFVMPLAILSGILLIKKNNVGYLLSSIVIIKGSALLISITAMIICQVFNDVSVDMLQVFIFIIFDIIMAYPLIMLLKNIKE